MRISDWSSDVCSSDLFDQKGDAYSLYGQGTLNFTPDLRLIAGLRYSHTTKDGFFTQQTVSGTPLNTIGPDRRGDLSESYVDPSATLQADLTPDIMVYRSEEHTSELQSLMRISYA